MQQRERAQWASGGGGAAERCAGWRGVESVNVVVVVFVCCFCKHEPFCSPRSDKPRVYQGVRVKTTVKELLQRHRAREANSKKLKTISQACLDLQDLCQSTFPSIIPSGHYVDPPAAITPADTSSCSARALQMRTAPFQAPESACGIHMQGNAFSDTQQQFGDMTLPSNCYNGSNNNNIIINNNNNNNNNNHTIGDGGYNNNHAASLPPPPTFPLPWYYGLSSDADYYGHEMAPGSPESQKLYSPMDHNSYSPQDSFSSSSSSCYDSPTRMESSHHGFASEHFHYQHCNLQDCYCLSHCWSGQQEGFTAPEYTPCYNPTDYPYTCLVEESFRRDLQTNAEMCYNIL
ncbi:colorectal cancer associated 2 isoform X1 [Solea solea]|uniref:colorectal cancer associated 2 isoform X1 n=1 Tax=Solea solea TaxID=90069 RepID=UPI00272A16CF|nr:colorectal cancer associated 2 isoform X1 [Solea solea]